jgi:hypothetical protein
MRVRSGLEWSWVSGREMYVRLEICGHVDEADGFFVDKSSRQGRLGDVIRRMYPAEPDNTHLILRARGCSIPRRTGCQQYETRRYYSSYLSIYTCTRLPIPRPISSITTSKIHFPNSLPTDHVSSKSPAPLPSQLPITPLKYDHPPAS